MIADGIYDIPHPGGAGVFLPAGPGGRWLYGVISQPGSRQPADLAEESITRRIRLGAGVATLQPSIERIGSFSFAAQLAERFRRGSAFLVGDAAHRVTPRGGTRMNTAIHDGYDLGWKLAWVLRGWAEQALQIDLGRCIAHVWLSSGTGRVSTLDLLGPGLTLFTGPRTATWSAAAVAGHLPLAFAAWTRSPHARLAFATAARCWSDPTAHRSRSCRKARAPCMRFARQSVQPSLPQLAQKWLLRPAAPRERAHRPSRPLNHAMQLGSIPLVRPEQTWHVDGA